MRWYRQLGCAVRLPFAVSKQPPLKNAFSPKMGIASKEICILAITNSSPSLKFAKLVAYTILAALC